MEKRSISMALMFIVLWGSERGQRQRDIPPTAAAGKGGADKGKGTHFVGHVDGWVVECVVCKEERRARARCGC